MNLKRSNRQTTRTTNACGGLVDIAPFAPRSSVLRAAPRPSPVLDDSRADPGRPLPLHGARPQGQVWARSAPAATQRKIG
jgi:hypothetical protein